MTKPFPLAPALWTATAPPAAALAPLAESRTVDVTIIGGGYCGLSAALHLAERSVKAVVLEAEEPGWGGSGRNGGQVIPGLKWDPDELTAMFGVEAGERLIQFAGGTADLVFDLIERHGLDVPRKRSGWIQGAHIPAGIDIVAKRAEQWARRGVPGARVIDKTEAERLIGTDKYLGGWIDPRGGTVQPLAYARGLVNAAAKAGAAIHAPARVTKLERRSGKWLATTHSGGTVTSDRVLVATNAYVGDLIPGVRTTVVAPNSYQIATEPLSDNVARSILPEGHFVSDTRQLLFYFRLDHQNRLLMGGRGPLREPKSPADWAHLERIAAKLFSQIAGAPIAHRWCGRVAVTRDFLPHIHEPEPGLTVNIGCMGRGVGLQTAMGKALADYAASGDARTLPLPIAPAKSLPFHSLHKAYLSAIIAWYRLRDGGLA